MTDDPKAVLAALKANFVIGPVWAAEEFKAHNSPDKLAALKALTGDQLRFEPHLEFKQRVPHAIGLIRTGDTTPYANLIIESA